MKLLVASMNPIKLEAVKEAFEKYFSGFEIVCSEVDSNVSHTPMGDAICNGAEARAKALQLLAKKSHPDADFFIGLEGGVISDKVRYFLTNRACIIGQKTISFGSSGQYEIPASISKRILAGEELGPIIDSITKDSNSKQKGGAIEFLSKGVMNRKEISAQAVLMALFPHINSLYQ